MAAAEAVVWPATKAAKTMATSMSYVRADDVGRNVNSCQMRDDAR